MEIHHFLDTVLLTEYLWIVWWVKNIVFAKRSFREKDDEIHWKNCNFTPRQVGFLSKNTSSEEYKAPAKKLGSYLLLEWKVT